MQAIEPSETADSELTELHPTVGVFHAEWEIPAPPLQIGQSSIYAPDTGPGDAGWHHGRPFADDFGSGWERFARSVMLDPGGSQDDGNKVAGCVRKSVLVYWVPFFTRTICRCAF